MSTSHLAGPPITVQGRVLQRCLICGEKLIDSLGQCAPLNPDGTVDPPSTWQPGAFVRVSGFNPQSFTLVAEDPESTPLEGKLPYDSCIDLVEN